MDLLKKLPSCPPSWNDLLNNSCCLFSLSQHFYQLTYGNSKEIINVFLLLHCFPTQRAYEVNERKKIKLSLFPASRVQHGPFNGVIFSTTEYWAWVYGLDGWMDSCSSADCLAVHFAFLTRFDLEDLHLLATRHHHHGIDGSSKKQQQQL